LLLACLSCCNQALENSQEGRERGSFHAHRSKVSKLRKIKAHVLVCKHKTCLRQGGKNSIKALKRTLKEQDLRGAVMVTKVKCLDQCGRGPVMVVYPEGVWYGGVDEECARQIVTEHLAEGHVIEKRVLHEMREP
jgi:NADP-reducing hydrogenase subunit HndC